MFRISLIPADDGDCVLVEIGPESSPFRVLIDGGRTATKPALCAVLAALPGRVTPLIDVIVLTHVDADHIEGLLALPVDDQMPTIGDVWFNGARHMAAAAGHPPPPERARPNPPGGGEAAKVLSIKQGIDFSRAIKARALAWNDAFGGGPVMTTETKPPDIPLGPGRLRLLGPPQRRLKAFAPEWAKQLQTMGIKDISTLRGRRRPVPTVDNLNSLAQQLNTPDRTKPNGTSIAFIIEHDGRRALFAADAHPGDIANALGRMGEAAGRIELDAVKVAHHGSGRNNTSELIDLIDSPLWLVSTSGAHHEHPDPEAMARIVLAPPAGKTLAFNYRSAFTAEWCDAALMAKYGYKVCYAEAGHPLIVDISRAPAAFIR